jgi:FkbM family methyltransferase
MLADSSIRRSSGGLPAAGRLVARNRRRYFARALASVCRQYMAWFSNLSYDLASNGEAFVLDTLSRFKPAVIFDAGANVGDWSAVAARLCPTATVHAFEISTPTFEKLKGRFSGSSRVVCRNVGLSDHADTIRIRHYDGLEALTTSTDYPHPFPYRELAAEVTSGTLYSQANSIRHIDLLKIDVEGMEQMVLRGCDGLFQARTIDLVQFEYGRVSIVNRFLLRDFYEFFTSRGFRVGKIYPNYVDFRDYDMGDEDFLGPNYLACRVDRTDYLEAFGGAF